MKQNFVEFLSPGTFVSESTRKPIDSRDIEVAKAMAREIVDRDALRADAVSGDCQGDMA